MHVVFGAAWTIIDLFLGFVLGPILGRLSVPARIEFTTKLMPKMVADHADRGHATLAPAGSSACTSGTVTAPTPDHGWVVASYIVVGVMAVIALGLLEPANIAVLFELKKPRPEPGVIERLMNASSTRRASLGAHADRDARDHDQARQRLMDDEPHASGHPGRDGLAGADRRRRDLPRRPPARACAAGSGGGPARPLRRCCSPATCSRSRESATSPGSASSRSPLGPARLPITAGMIEYAFLQRPRRGGTADRVTLSLSSSRSTSRR